MNKNNKIQFQNKKIVIKRFLKKKDLKLLNNLEARKIEGISFLYSN